MEIKVVKDFQLVEVEKLVPYINNARTHSPAQINKLRSSIREFGFISPLVIDRDFNVLVGHGRLEAAKEEASNPGKQQIDLIDGEEFINKIAQYGIGVREVITYEIDEEFFLKI